MKDRMLAGELYLADDPELLADLARAQGLIERYNRTAHAEPEERERLLAQLLGAIGERVVIRPPFHCDYGSNITVGAGTFVNFGCVMLDVAPIALGAACRLGRSRTGITSRCRPGRADAPGRTRTSDPRLRRPPLEGQKNPMPWGFLSPLSRPATSPATFRRPQAPRRPPRRRPAARRRAGVRRPSR